MGRPDLMNFAVISDDQREAVDEILKFNQCISYNDQTSKVTHEPEERWIIDIYKPTA